MAGGSEHPGVLYFYSESIGLGANGACAAIATLLNLGVVERGSVSSGVLFLSIGGVIQLLCSLKAYRSYDHFGGSVFGFYAAFWALLGLETILSSSINLLHIALLAVGVLLIIVAPLVNGFYTLLVATIAIASSLELALRVNSESSTLRILAAISEIFVVLATCYGAAAAVLHGIHERQVLPGFDNALIETALWRRKALKARYSEGTWANPLPLGSFCCAMGFAGLGARSQDSSLGSTLWLGTFAVLLGVVSLLHGLRHERVWAVSSICDTCLFAVSAMNTEGYGSDSGAVFIAFAVIRVFILAFAIAEGFSLMHNMTFFLEVISLLVVGIGSFLWGYNSEMPLSIIFYVASASATYNGIAELANSIAQKVLFPSGQDFSIMKLFRINKLANENMNKASSLKDSTDHTVNNIGNSKHNHQDDEETGGFPIEMTRRVKKWKSLKSEYRNSVDQDEENGFKYPGDHHLLGHSDFQSPLFVMTVGITLYSLLMSIGMFANSEQAILDSALVLLITQVSSLLICASRGQTCFGFLNFTFVFEGTVLLTCHFSQDKTAQNLIGIALVLQIAWLAVSHHEFRLLSATIVTHLVSLLLCMVSESNAGQISLQYIAGVFFILTSMTSLVILGLLLGSTKSVLFRLLLESSAADSEKLCPIGFASDRGQFDECIKILKEGGVCCIPTDTVYCLACAADRPDAIKRIYDIKSRPAEKPLSLWLGSINDIKSVAPEGKGWSPKLFSFMDAMWPGSVSLVVSRGSWLQRMGVGSAADLIGTPDSIALRVPNSTLTVALLKETGPLAITSANPSGACDCTHHNKVDDVIASKIDYILADGASPMTIASSVVDVRNVDNDELFFYRVGCVPESFIWSKLKDTQEEMPSMLAGIDSVNARVIESFMAQIIKLAGCETFRVHMLISGDCDSDHDIMKMPWPDITPRIKSAFMSGISFYSGREDMQQEDDESQMIVPVRDTHGKIIAVLQLLNKVSNGSMVLFKKEDLAFAELASSLFRDNISVRAVADAKSLDLMETTNVIVLSEHGYYRTKGRVTLEKENDLPPRPQLSRRASDGFAGRMSRRSLAPLQNRMGQSVRNLLSTNVNDDHN